MAMEHEDGGGKSGLVGAFRLLAALAVIVLGVIAILLVFDVIPRETFGELASKLVATVAILAAVGGAVALIARSR